MHEQQIRIQSGEAVLAGTLCVPNTTGPFPATLMGSARQAGEPVAEAVIDGTVKWIRSVVAANNNEHATSSAGA